MIATPTLEVRWFHPGPIPGPVAAWFDALGEPVADEARTDRYLAPSSDALGVKLREGRIEMKRRDGMAGPVAAGASRTTAEAWTKWSFALAESVGELDGPWLAVAKRRRQRVLELTTGQCALELSAVTVGVAAWWSVCLEAEGDTVDRRRTSLAAGAARWLGVADAPALTADAAFGYPAWLRKATGG
ncbi:hypothetical protein [Rubrivirga sp. IMCC43871]|uniref:hypothetical protein n=1 Tax=Rubrivirga sp. IMCC43871 TaxID=3391575 RepID=UPI0039900BD5